MLLSRKRGLCVVYLKNSRGNEDHGKNEGRERWKHCVWGRAGGAIRRDRGDRWEKAQELGTVSRVAAVTVHRDQDSGPAQGPAAVPVQDGKLRKCG